MNKSSPFEEGPLDAKLILIAEAPSTVELVQNRPLVGPAGKLANEYLAAAGVTRSDCLIMNVCRSRISKIDDYLGKKGLTELGLAQRADLQERLSRTSANTIVPLGALATACLVGDRRIMKLRGSPLACTLDGFEDTEVIPTIHPAAAMKYKGNPKVKHYIISDLKKALRHSKQPGIQVPQRDLIIEPTLSEAIDYLHQMRRASRVSFDIEVYNHQVSCISFTDDPAYCMSIPLSDEYGKDYWSEENEAIIWFEIACLLGDPTIEKVAQYGSFDISFLLLQNKIRTRGPLLDTYIAHKIMYPDFPSGLDFLCSIYTDEPYYKDDRKLWNTLDKDIRRFWRYNAKDSAATLECWIAIEEDLNKDEGFKRTYDITLSMLEPCMYLMTKGMKLDMAALKQSREDVQTKLEERQKALVEASEVPFSPTSPKQCIAYFYGTKGLKPYISRKSGNPTCDDKALSRIIRRYNLPEARIVQEIRALRKLRDTYLDLGYDKDERLRCFYNIRGTSTGRLSSSKTVRGTGLNMQNLHPAFKHFLVPD